MAGSADRKETDERTHPRVESVFRARYATLDQLVVGYSADLSKGGMFLASDQFLPVNSTLTLKLELPSRGGELSVTCRVVYTRDKATADKTGKPAGMGVQFLDLDEQALTRIGQFIAEKSVAADADPQSSRGKPLSILVVDDDHSSREAAAKPFRERGDQVRTASDGVDALAACLKSPPDVILSDVQMPRMDGWQLARVVRSRPQLAQVPMLFLTRLRGEDERLKGYQLGIDDFVPKPSRPEELIARVDRVVRRIKRPSPAHAQKMLRGDLEQVSLASVLSFLELEKKTGILSVMSDQSAKIHIEEGRLLKVEPDGGPPVDATSRQLLYKMLDWRRGHFEFVVSKVACEDEVHASLTSILLDHARVSDEAAR